MIAITLILSIISKLGKQLKKDETIHITESVSEAVSILNY